MPSTYTLISSNVLSSSAASVAFTVIPSTYTDLVLRISGRTDTGAAANDLQIRFQSGTGVSTYSWTRIIGNGSAASSSSNTGDFAITSNDTMVGGTATADTFNSAEVYIPSYTVAQNKPISLVSFQERNATTPVNMNAVAGLYRNTSAIANIYIFPGSGNFVSGSSFYLYGISKS
jgi:hypothetical protein